MLQVYPVLCCAAAFGLIDGSPQASLCLFVGLQVPRLKCRIPFPEQSSCIVVQPWFMVGKHLNNFEIVSAQKFIYERTTDVCPSRSVPSAKTIQSVSSKQWCRAQVTSSIHTLTIFIVGLCLQLSILYAAVVWSAGPDYTALCFGKITQDTGVVSHWSFIPVWWRHKTVWIWVWQSSSTQNASLSQEQHRLQMQHYLPKMITYLHTLNHTTKHLSWQM